MKTVWVTHSDFKLTLSKSAPQRPPRAVSLLDNKEGCCQQGTEQAQRNFQLWFLFLDFNLITRSLPFPPSLQPLRCAPLHGPSNSWPLPSLRVIACIYVCGCTYFPLFSFLVLPGFVLSGALAHTLLSIGAHSWIRWSMALFFTGKESLSGCPQSRS